MKRRNTIIWTLLLTAVLVLGPLSGLTDAFAAEDTDVFDPPEVSSPEEESHTAVKTDCKGGHTWGEPDYKWAEDNSTVTASRECVICGESETEKVEPACEEISPATCIEKGEIRYTAVFENEAFEKQTKTSDTDSDPGAHDWEEWEVTKKAASTAAGELIRVCKNDGSHIQTKSIPKAKAPAKPRLSTKGAFGNKSFKISWNKAADASCYTFAYKKAGAKTWDAKMLTENGYILKDLKEYDLYAFRVRAEKNATAENEAVSGPYSTVCYRYMSIGKKVKATGDTKKMTVTWQKDAKATGYQILYSEKKSGDDLVDPAIVTVSGKEVTAKTIGKLKSGRTYYVRVRPVRQYSGSRYNGIMCPIVTVKTK